MSVATLTSNGLPLPHTSRYTGPLTATPLSAIADGSAAARLRESGYLLFRGLLPRAQVLNLRERYFRLFPSSFVQDGDYRRAAYAGVLPRALPAYGTCGHPAYQLVRQAEFTQFAEHPILQDTAARVLEAPVERQIGRASCRERV